MCFGLFHFIVCANRRDAPRPNPESAAAVKVYGCYPGKNAALCEKRA